MPTLSISFYANLSDRDFCRDMLGDVNRCESVIDIAIAVENLRE